MPKVNCIALKGGTVLRLTAGPTLLGKEISLYTNYPADGKKDFERTVYSTLSWHARNGDSLSNKKNPYAKIIDVDIYGEVKLFRSGTYHFYYVYKNSTVKSNGSLYVQIEPTIHVGLPGSTKIIPSDSIRCQTVLAKCLGPVNSWESKLRVSKESGYNMIHFTPIQELGGSRSCYSLANQLKPNPDFKIAPPAKAAGRITFDDTGAKIPSSYKIFTKSQNIRTVSM